MVLPTIIQRAFCSAVTEFIPVEIRGLTAVKPWQPRTRTRNELSKSKRPRYGDKIDWPNIWPAAATFHPAIVPLPIRQGYPKNLAENQGITPEAYGNAELMKIPNFLHLTKAHVAKHCETLKKFCTAWPSGLDSEESIEKHYPIEVIYSNYLFSAPSIRDSRARVARIKLPLSSLRLDDRAKRKLLRIAIGPGPGQKYSHYDWTTDVLELTAGRCPSVIQNIDYLRYTLSVLVLESKQNEPWEQNSTDYDWLAFDWSKSSSRKRLMDLCASPTDTTDTAETTCSIEQDERIAAYRAALTQLWSDNDVLHGDQWIQRPRQPRFKHNPFPDILDVPFEPVHGADRIANIEDYGQATRKLFGLGADTRG